MNVSEAFKSRSLKSMIGDHLLRNGLSTISYDQTRKTSTIKLLSGPLVVSKQRRVESVFNTMNKLGPIAGRLFISTEKLAFCSDRPIAKVTSATTGEPLRFHYKIVIPLRKIERLNQNESTKKPSQNYLQVVTSDEFEFWFMGFRSYNKTFKWPTTSMQSTKA
uniref:GRAM domain-containing protein n=1 Tax=Chenopodium quinoa TaxID=63459 RepID=A0A803LS05_CHEQI